jgi:hypothetical protein
MFGSKLGCFLLGMKAGFLIFKFLEKPMVSDAFLAVAERSLKELGIYLASCRTSEKSIKEAEAELEEDELLPDWLKEAVKAIIERSLKELRIHQQASINMQK